MKRTLWGLVALLALSPVSALTQSTPVPQLMNFQGRLAKPDGTPVTDGNYPIRFSLWTAATGGTEKWSQSTGTITVRNGAFAALLNTGTGFENGANAANLFSGNLFLEIKVGNDAPLTPRQPLVSVAYAMKADSVKDGAITNAGLANGTITADKFASNIFNPLAWLLGGNSGVTNGFIGTTDNNPFTFKVNNRRAMQYAYAEDLSDPGNEYRTLNVLGGSEINSIAPGVVGATLVGGGQDYFTGTDFPNTVTNNFGTVVGGALNKADGFSFVGGGYNNKATGFYSTVAGGTYNTAGNDQAFVGGGILNTAGGFASVIPGGQGNVANGDFSFAAGHGANAAHPGSFVWADTSGGALSTTAPSQFLVRATGGVKLFQNTTLEFGFGVAGKESNAGKIGYATFTPSALDIVGGGIANSRFIKFWAEGGSVFTGQVAAPNYTTFSDARYKKDIATVNNALGKIEQLRGVTFDWNREKWQDKHFAKGRQVGFIAQEVEKVLPELVSTDANGYKSVAYANVVPVLVEAVKQQQKEIKGLKARLKQQKTQQAQIDALKRRLDAMQSHR